MGGDSIAIKMNSNISTQEAQKIKQQLPYLKKLVEEDDAVLNGNPYQPIFVSVFDHWLSEAEASEQVYVDEDIEELRSRRKKFRDFITGVYQQLPLYTWKYKRHHRLHIQQPTTLADVLRKCDFENLYSLSGKKYGFLLPDCSAVYAENWDWTNVIWYLDKDKIEPLVVQAQKAGLHILT